MLYVPSFTLATGGHISHSSGVLCVWTVLWSVALCEAGTMLGQTEANDKKSGTEDHHPRYAHIKTIFGELW